MQVNLHVYAYQIPDLKFKNYTVADGLVHNMINAIAMDKNGFLWIATDGGISRFDGWKFVNFNRIEHPEVELPSLQINDMVYDGNRLLWLSSDRGVFSFDVISHAIYQPKNQHFLYDTKSITYDEQQAVLYFAPLHNYIASYNAKTHEIDTFQNNNMYKTNDLCFYKGCLYSAIDRGSVWSLNPSKRQFKEYLKDYWIFRFSVDSDELYALIWQGDNYKYHVDSDSFEVLPMLPYMNNGHMYISSGLCRTSLLDKNTRLVSSNITGICVYDMTTKTVVKEILRDLRRKDGPISNKYNCLFKDRSGIIWLGTWEGLSMIHPNNQQFKSGEWAFMDSRGYNLLSGIKRDKYNKDILWIGSNGSGVICYNQRLNKVEAQYNNDAGKFGGNDTNYLYRWTEFIEQMNNNDIVVGSYNGLLRIRQGKVKRLPLVPGVDFAFPMQILKVADNAIWVPCGYGLAFVNTDNLQFKLYIPDTTGGKSIAITSSVKYKKSQLLVSSSDDLYLFNTSNNTFQSIGCIDADGNRIKEIDQLVFDSLNATIYINTNSGVYFRNIQSVRFDKLVYKYHLKGLYRHSMIVDVKGRLWLYTSNALFSYDPKIKVFKRYDQKDGIYNNLSDPPNLFEFENEIYIGYRGAYTKFNPLETDNEPKTECPIITSVNVAGRDTIFDYNQVDQTPFIYHYNDKFFRVEFTSINFSSSDKLLYEYQLNDDQWHGIGNSHTINFNQLDPGLYSLSVRAINRSGVYSEIRNFKFQVLAPFWMTWWFKLLIAGLLLTVFYIIYRYRVSVIQKEESIKTEYNKHIAELESRALRTQMNPHFVFNSLNSIQSYIQKNEKEASSKYLSKFAKLTRQIFDYSNEQTISLEQELSALQTYIELEQMRFVNRFEFNMLIDKDIDTKLLEVPPMIIQPFVENAIWHGIMHKESGVGIITLNLKVDNGILHVNLVDNGIGRAQSQQYRKASGKGHHSGGMRLTKDRLDIINKRNDLKITAEIKDLKTNEGVALGTEVNLYIPL